MKSAPVGEPAVVVDGLSKKFRIPQEQVHTLKERALHPFRHIAFNTFDALKDISFEVGEGEFFGIVGRNGSGKSTLLKLLAGIYGADTGDIAVRGRMSTFIELGVGFNPDLAAYDNVITNAIMLGLTPKEAASRYEKVIEFAELQEFQDLKIKNYSSGMLVRLAFSVAIEAEADILLIDEVLAVGDAAFQQKCFDQFNRLRDENRTILFVTHDMGMVERFCSRAMLLERGEMVTLDKPVPVARKYLELNFEEAKRQGGEMTIGSSPTGDGSAEIEEVWLEDAAAERREMAPYFWEMRFRARVRFNSEAEDPVFAIVVVNEQGLNVWALSTLHQDRETGTFQAGDTAVITMNFRNILGPGRYETSMTISRQGTGFNVMHRLEKASTFVVHNPTPTGGLIDAPYTVDVTPTTVQVESA